MWYAGLFLFSILRKSTLWICLVLSFSCVVLKADSQINVEEKANELLNQARQAGLFNDSSLEPLLQLKTYAKENTLPPFQFEAYYMLGKHYLLKLKSTQARDYFLLATQTAGDAEQRGFALDRLGISYLRLEYPDSALTCFQESIQLYNSADLQHRLWNPLQGISMVYQFKGNYERAKKYGEEALNSIDKYEEEIAKAVLLDHMMNLSSEFGELDDYANYLDEYLQSISFDKMGESDQHLAAHFPTDEKSFDQVEKIKYAIEKLSVHEPTLSLLSGYYRLGKQYSELKEYRKAIAAWNKGLELDASLKGAGFSLVFSQELANAYAQVGEYKNALHFFQLNKSLSDSLSRLENLQKIDELQLGFETAQKEKTILSQQAEIEQKNRQQILTYLLASLLAGLAISIIIGLRSKLKMQKLITIQQRQLYEAEVSDLHQKSQLLSLEGMLKGQEDERKRIAYDLHDGLGGLLSTIRLQIDNSDKSKNGEAKELVDEACREVRRIAHNMMPHALLKMGLATAITDLVRTLNTNSGIDISFQNLTENDRIDENREIMLYRIAQELLQNAIKHSKATSILVQLSKHNGTMTLVVEDDGVGYDMRSLDTEGLGFKGLQHRVVFMNGKTEINSAPGQGTTVQIDIPVE